MEGKFDWENHATAKEEYDWQLQSKERLIDMAETALNNYLIPVEKNEFVIQRRLKEL